MLGRLRAFSLLLSATLTGAVSAAPLTKSIIEKPKIITFYQATCDEPGQGEFVECLASGPYLDLSCTAEFMVSIGVVTARRLKSLLRRTSESADDKDGLSVFDIVFTVDDRRVRGPAGWVRFEFGEYAGAWTIKAQGFSDRFDVAMQSLVKAKKQFTVSVLGEGRTVIVSPLVLKNLESFRSQCGAKG